MFPSPLVAALVAAICIPVSLFASRADWEFPAATDTYEAVYTEARILSQDHEDSTATMRLGAMMHDAPTSSALLTLKMAGVVADLRPSPSPEVEARLRDVVLELREMRRRWGAEPLIFSALIDRRGRGSAELNDYLLDQFLDDDVAGNAHGATEVLLAGLRTWPDAVLPAIEQRWDDTAPGSSLDQEELRLALLLLCHATDVPRAWVGYVDSRTFDGIVPPLVQFSPVQRERLADVAARVLCTPLEDDTHFLQKDILIPLARFVLYQHSPEFAPAIGHVVRHGDYGRVGSDRMIHALILYRRIDLLFTPDFERLVIEISGHHWAKGHDLLLEAYIPRVDQPEEAEEEGYGESPYWWADGIQEEIPVAIETLRQGRDLLVPVIERNLNAGEPWQQLRRGRLLLAIGEGARAEEIFHLAVALSTADNYAVRYPTEALLSGRENGILPEAELLQAGIAVAVEERDAGMLKGLAEVTTEVVEGWSLHEDAALIDFLVESLHDDEEVGNAASAYAVLRPHSQRLEPLLRELETDPAKDWQVRRAAKRLLAGEYYLSDF